MTVVSTRVAPPVTSLREDAVTVVLGVWLIAGLAVDGWAHNNLAQLETFFTPWHALFYSGFAASAAWILRCSTRRRDPARDWIGAVPAGYGLGVVGLVLFGAGGVGDMVWHTIFGIEANIDALMSPTHLLLYLGGVLILTSPLRAAWGRAGPAPSLGPLAPALLSMSLATGLTAFMFLYLSPFLQVDMSSRPDDGYLGFLVLRSGISAIVLTTFVLMAPALMLLRRWRTPLGSFTVMFALVAALIQAVGAFERPWMVLVAALGGMGTDWLVQTVNPGPARPWRFRAFAFAAPVWLWSVYTVAVAVTEGIGWEVEIWSGAIVWSGIAALGLCLLMVPGGLSEREPAAEVAEL